MKTEIFNEIQQTITTILTGWTPFPKKRNQEVYFEVTWEDKKATIKSIKTDAILHDAYNITITLPIRLDVTDYAYKENADYALLYVLGRNNVGRLIEVSLLHDHFTHAIDDDLNLFCVGDDGAISLII